MLTKLTLPAPSAAVNSYEANGDQSKPCKLALLLSMMKPIPNMGYSHVEFAPNGDFGKTEIMGQRANLGGDYLVAGPLTSDADFLVALKKHRQGREWYVAGVYTCKSQAEATEVLWSLICAHYGITA
jgi:hypothetical protein